MKNLIFIVLLASLTGYAQFGPQQIISIKAEGPQTAVTGDIDGDGDLDVISASQFDDTIAWYENLDGQGSFGPQQTITTFLSNTQSAVVADIDGDNDLDVVATSATSDLVVWYENLDGQGTFSLTQGIANTADEVFDAIAADIDEDGDIDVISASNNDNKIAWYENLDGQGNFDNEIIISLTQNNGRSIISSDIDNDGDLDIVSSSSGSVIVSWYENMDGLGTFGSQNPIGIPPSPSSTLSVFAADLDGDMDMDVITASAGNNKVAWYENLDGNGSFSEVQLISNLADVTFSVIAADIDNDGDADVLSASAVDNIIGWYENDGTGIFGPQQIISTQVISPRDVYAADIDNDGDIDVLSASQNDNKIAWYENQTILSVDTNTLNPISVYPNPVEDILTLTFSNYTKIEQLHLYDALGRLVLSKQEDFDQIEVASLQKGVFFLKLETSEGIFTIKVVKE